ncbi:hypothetical protein P4O66_001962 [Electrophorus voltai]|uniref:Reverse transcriptase domain-containing protein n=1 Tax=Electrophorus voltai TaxID=2609070 RepID=A0AAD9E3E6_9TELE|nr:hypothetical protein P4O66_001962 [Electrophorus voltai]
MNLADHMLSITVENHELQFLVDTGATHNLLYKACVPLSGATVLCSPEGLSVNFPNGTTIHCFNGGDLTGQYLMIPVMGDWADIYWGLLQPETTAHGGLLSAYLTWKPWITLLKPKHEDWYQDEFNEDVEGQIWEISSETIFVGPEGVAASIDLTPEQLEWYMMQDEAAPQVSLALHPAHQAKELGAMVLRNALEDCKLPPNVTLIQYVDDLLLARNYAESCLQATENMLMHLWQQGFVVCKEKLQVARKQDMCLGQVVFQNATGLSPSHRVTILHHPRPERVKDMLSFLGLTGYSRHLIPDYVGYTQALRDMVKVQGMRNLNVTLERTEDGETAFIRLKQLLAQAVDLASPDYMRPFFLDVSEIAGTNSMFIDLK